jgi:hypothetical protein
MKIYSLEMYCMYNLLHGRRNFKDTNPLMSSLLVNVFGVVCLYSSFVHDLLFACLMKVWWRVLGWTRLKLAISPR